MAEIKDEHDDLAADRKNNPYATPVDYERNETLKTDGRSTLAIVVLAILIIPASVIAGFTACTGIVFASSAVDNAAVGPGFVLGLIVGGILAIWVFALIFRRIMAISRNRHLPR